MQQNQSTAESAKSMPILSVSSDHSLSYKSFHSAPTGTLDNDDDKQPESRASVKALIEKFGSLQGKSNENNVINFNVKKKPFVATDGEKLETSCNECNMYMEGDDDAMRLGYVKDTVKNHVFKIFTSTAHFKENRKPLLVDKNAIRTVHFGLKNNMSDSDGTEDNMDKRFWRNLIAMAKVNHTYNVCMTQIMNRQKFPNLKDVKEYVKLALKKGEESEFMESELLTYIKKYLEKFSIKLNSKLNEELNKAPYLSHHTRLSILRMELEKMQANMKIARDNIILLQKQNKDLLAKLNSYGHENIHKVSLEKLLKSEQEKNDKLKETIASVFEKKMYSYYVNEVNMSSNSYKSK